ncbi:uncharacterized protein [Lolium perenne]|uniref:uncharacterized protein n=1 Tax=Lolium perenne TaxID=4522 RepID=UPI0021F5BEB1|nr:uncharacterized protein LOC127341582 [Lolium perenne]
MGISAMQDAAIASDLAAVLSGDWPRRCFLGTSLHLCPRAPLPRCRPPALAAGEHDPVRGLCPLRPSRPPPYESPLTPPSGERPICRFQFWLYSCRKRKRLLVKSCNQIMLIAKTGGEMDDALSAPAPGLYSLSPFPLVRYVSCGLSIAEDLVSVKECITQFLVRLPICQFIVPRNLNLLAIPLSVSQEKRRTAVNTTV